MFPSSFRKVTYITSGNGGGLSDSELGGDTKSSEVVLVRVLLTERVIESEVDTTVGDDTSDGDTEAVVETQEATRTAGGLD